MHPEQKDSWIEYVTSKIAAQEEQIRQKESDYSKTENAMTSHHDHLRQDLASELNTQHRSLAQQKTLLEEIKGADLRFQVEPGAYVDLLVNGEHQQVLFMNTQGDLPDVDVITPQSPMGQSIEGKITGDKGSFEVGSRKFTVEIQFIL